MIVKDVTTLRQALELTRGKVARYVDRWDYVLVEEPVRLEGKLLQQIRNNDIAVVVCQGQEQVMEDYDWSLKQVKKDRRVAEQKAIRQWVTEHPEKVKALRKKLQEVGAE